MQSDIPTLTNGRRPWTIYIVGGGPMGLMVAIELATMARQMGLHLIIYVYENAAYGGGAGDWAATIASHAWLHWDGAFYVKSQPEVSVTLQHSTRRLRELAPYAFTYPLAFTIDLEDDLPAFFEPLGVWYQPLDEQVARRLLARCGMRLRTGAKLVRVGDAVIDTRLLGFGLMREAQRLGVRLVHHGIAALEPQGEAIGALRLSDGETVPVAPEDHVVLACGGRIRPLLAGAGLHLPGLRLFGSQLLAADLGLRVLFTAIQSVSIVPHEESGGGLVNVIGNANRRELTDEEGRRPHPDPEVTRQTRSETEDLYGIRLPDTLHTWLGVKAEITAGPGSQAHHARRVPAVSNVWVCITGKLSQTAACATSVSRQLLRHLIEDPVAWPIWEMLAAGRGPA